MNLQCVERIEQPVNLLPVLKNQSYFLLLYSHILTFLKEIFRFSFDL